MKKLIFSGYLFATAISALAQIKAEPSVAVDPEKAAMLKRIELMEKEQVYRTKAVTGYPVKQSLQSYKSIKLTADLSLLEPVEKEALKYMIAAAKGIDELFWLQSWGDKKLVLDSIGDENLKKFIALNYGPWDRLNDNKPFVEGVGEKPKGARFYPEDMTEEEWKALDDPKKLSPYSIIRREMDGTLRVLYYSEAYDQTLREVSSNVQMAGVTIMGFDQQLGQFLMERAASLLTNEFNFSDISWLGLLNNRLDLIIGPIENYEDERYGIKTAYEAYILLRDKEWGNRLQMYTALLPDLQKSLPVDAKYKPDLSAAPVNQIQPGTDDGSPKVALMTEAPQAAESKPGSSLAVFDVLYYAGHNNAGSKTIAVNLPNDEKLQEEYGTRRSQLKNVMKAKFDNMVVPISNLLIDPKQRPNINFEGFFSNVMFHEVAHGLGIKNTINNKGTVRDALGANHSAIEECKADVLGLYMVTRLFEMGYLNGKLDDYYVTFVSSVFRSVRFGAASAHGKANMITFNTLMKEGAIVRQKTGLYKVEVAKMKTAISNLAAELLMLQGDGNAEGVKKMLDERAQVGAELKTDLDRIAKAGIPVDLVFEQGKAALGLE